MTNSSYFLTDAEDGFGHCLVLKTSWSAELIDVIRNRDISVLRLTEAMGWNDIEVSFLNDLNDVGLRGVEIYSWDVKDISPLQCMTDLEYLGLQCDFNKAPDFSEFKKLRFCKLNWRPKAKTIFSCTNLESLNISSYPEDNLKPLENNVNLKSLQIISRKLTSLSGINALKNLNELILSDCSKLNSIDDIEKSENISVLYFNSCKKIDDISVLSKVHNIKKLVLDNCGDIDSLKPLVQCKKLETISFTGDTRIKDGDLSPLLKLPKLKNIFFNNKKNYSHNRESIVSIIG